MNEPNDQEQDESFDDVEMSNENIRDNFGMKIESGSESKTSYSKNKSLQKEGTTKLLHGPY